MSANSQTSSEDSDGGAPLYRPLATPIAPPTRRPGEVNLKTPSEEEKILVRASENFGDLRDPFAANTPSIPQSIQPGTYAHRAAYAQPTPSRAHNGFNRFGNSQSAGRYRSSTTAMSGLSSSVPRFRPGVGNTGFNNGAQLADESGMFSPQQVFASLSMATQYVNVTPGLPLSCQTHLIGLLQDISQGFTGITTQLRRERDSANRSREEEHERFKRAMDDLEKLQKVVDELKLDKNTLETQLAHSAESQGLLKDHIKDLKEQLAAFQKQLDNLTVDALRFHEHHDKIVEDYKVQDEKHFKAMAELENEVKALRTVSGSIVSHDDVFSTPKQPESVNNVTGECTTNSPESAKKSPAANDKVSLLNGLHQSPEPKKDGFVPNPHATPFAPAPARTEVVPDNANCASQSESSGSSTDHHSEASSGNSGEVILYTGNGHQQNNNNKALAAYVGPPAPGAGGAPTFFRTPFGIVFGEYPTVEENGRLPGDKFIPRDKLEWNEIDVQRALAHLYDLCKGYCANCHIQGPPNVPYDRLPEQESYTWHYLLQQVYKDPEHAASHLAYLLNTKAFSPYVLERTCVDYLLKKILTPQVFIGFSEQMDGHLRALQGQLASSADSREGRSYNRNRQRVIEDHAKIIRAIATSREVSEFRRRTVDRHANIMSALLDPVRSQGVTAEEAQKSLRIMVAACWDISIKVWSSGMTLHYVFPECAAKFAPGTMDALNAHMMGALSPIDLVNSMCRVSLVVTPTMTLRDDRDAVRMQCHAIHKAQVLVMK